MQTELWTGVGALAAMAVASGYAQHRRNKRIDMDKVGVVPWTTVQFAALFCGLILASIAVHSAS